MKVHVKYCYITKEFYLNEDYIKFEMSIYDDDNKQIVIEGVQARLVYNDKLNNEDDFLKFEDAFNNIQWVVRKCLHGSNCNLQEIMLFYDLYKTYFDELEKGTREARDKDIYEDIEILKEKLKHGVLQDIDNPFEDRIKLLQFRINCLLNRLKDIKEESEKYKEEKEKLDSLNQSLSIINQLLTKHNEY